MVLFFFLTSFLPSLPVLPAIFVLDFNEALLSLAAKSIIVPLVSIAGSSL